MNKPSIITIPIQPFGMVHCHLVIGATGRVLVGTGTPGSEDKIERALKKHGRGFRDVTLIVITHAHTNHAGSQWRLTKPRIGAVMSI
ncbi:MBL fold metallo-hydrolase [Paraburkholderia sp. CI3]|uniref:MBL fold metallo-hydrolase n=1 Tax=Paraburkholderia sp. CI3 TaxID=2991060 RepID=UPI003D20188C